MLQLVLVHSDNYRNWVFSSSHPTQGRRFDNGRALIVEACQKRGIEFEEVAPRVATRAELESVHSPTHVSRVIDEAKSGEWAGARVDLAELAATFVGGTLVALEHLQRGDTLLAVNLPGAKHHAQFDRSSGFCVFADLVIAAKMLTNDGKRVAIFDFDAHHGDGTENLSLSDPNILTFSVHEKGIFPGTGNESDAAHLAFNHPLSAGSGNHQLLAAAAEFIELAHEFAPDYIFIAAGGDGHEADPLAHLEYTESGAGDAMRALRQAFATTPILLGGAGGYRPDDATPAMWCESVMGLVA